MMLSLDTAYRSFGGEVEASSTPTICRLSDSRRHQLWAIAPTRFCRTRTAPLVLRGLIAHSTRLPCNRSRARRCRAHRIPHSTYRDDAYAPLHEAGWREEDTDFEKGKADYFSRPIWTTQITLNRLAKFVLTRN